MEHKNQKPMTFVTKVALMTVVFTIASTIVFPHTPNYPYKSDHLQDAEIQKGDIDKFRQDRNLTQEQVDSEIQQTIWELLETDMHPAAIDETKAKELYNDACSIYTDICNKISREWSYDLQEKLTYQLLIIYLIKQIDERLSIQNKLRDTLSNLKIYRNDEERRGSAWHTNVKINVEKIATPREFWEVLTHEFGHTIDLGVIQGQASQKDPLFTEFWNIEWSIDDPSLLFYDISRENENVRKDSASYKDFVSGYAMKWVYEEFAESINLRFNHNALFAELAKSNPILAKKYTFFNDLYGGDYFKSDNKNFDIMANEKRPWDTTKLH